MNDYDGFMLIKRDLYGSVEKATQLDARISRLKKTGAGKKGSTRTWSVVFLQFSVTFQWSESRRESGRGMFLFIVVIHTVQLLPRRKMMQEGEEVSAICRVMLLKDNVF